MATISIKNSVDPAMDELIEARIYFMLGSTLASLRMLEVVIDKTAESAHSGSVVQCNLRAMEEHGRWHLISSQQHELTHALEGAVTRLRRSLLRQRKYRKLA